MYLVPLNCTVKCGYKSMLYMIFITLKNIKKGFPGGSVVKNLPANAGDMGSSCQGATKPVGLKS